MSGSVRINKADLVESVALNHDLTKAKANEIISGVFAAISGIVREGGHVVIRGFGRFESREHAGFSRRGKPARATRRMFLRCSTIQKFEVVK